MEDLIKLSVSGDITRENLEECSRVKSLSIEETYNQLSLEIAKRYDSGLLSYTDADWAMNNIILFGSTMQLNLATVLYSQNQQIPSIWHSMPENGTVVMVKILK